MRDPIVAAGPATEDEIDRHLADLTGGDTDSLDLVTWPLVSAWARKP